MLGDQETTQVLQRVSNAPDDTRALYELGYRLVAAGRPDVGAAFLGRCHDTAPENELVQYELGYALFGARRYREACEVLAAAIERGELSPSEHADALLLLCEASVYANRLDSAHSALERTRGVELSDEQIARADALALLLGRAGEGDLTRLDLRGWHFVQHGGILLRLVDASEVEGARGGRLLDASPGYAFTAAMLKLGALLTTQLGLRYERVYAGSDLSVPLSVAMARMLGAEALPFEPEQREPGLLVAKNLEELRAHQGQLVERGEIDLFCLQLDWTRTQSVTPDMVGYLARHSYLPWEGRHRVEADASGRPAKIKEPEPPGDLGQTTQDLIAICDRLELSDELKQLERFYRPRREQLVIGQPDRYPRRRLFTAHSPVVTDERIFP
jgi:tetratricopeptide (TPR) repeat protein